MTTDNKIIGAFKEAGKATEKAKVSMEELSKIAEQNEAILEAEAQHWAGVDCSIKISREVRRNDPCPCGSGKKAKNCCGAGKRHIPINIHKPKQHGTK